MSQGKQILITGATGTLGRHLIPKLLSEGHSLIHLGRSKLDLPGLRWARADFSRLEEVDPGIFQGLDAILHMANLTKEDPALDQRVAKLLFSRAAEAGVPSFFYASSIRVYGHRLGEIDEESPPKPCPFDSYGRRKLETELLLRKLAKKSRTRLHLLRIGHTLTPENIAKAPETLGLRFLLLWGRGYPHFIHIADVEKTIAALLREHRNLKFTEFNLTRDTATYLGLYAKKLPTWQRCLAKTLALPPAIPFLLFRRTLPARETRCALIRHSHLAKQGVEYKDSP
jgi:nucleoside-diphosphate-sugar epimerase